MTTCAICSHADWAHTRSNDGCVLCPCGRYRRAVIVNVTTSDLTWSQVLPAPRPVNAIAEGTGPSWRGIRP